jgi:GNAT superfamily N-acetyltransferase
VSLKKTGFSGTRFTLASQPLQDQVCFKSNPYHSLEKAILEQKYLKEAFIKNVKTVTVLEKATNKPVEVLVADVGGIYSEKTLYKGKDVHCLAVFSKEGKLLGDIRNLDPNEWKTEEEYSNVGKYLRLNRLQTYAPVQHKGIGSVLIDEAVERSKDMGLGGQLKVLALNDVDPYRFSPVPFYAKKGFINMDNPLMNKNELIEEFKGSVNADEFADMFLLTPEVKDKVVKDFVNAQGE